MKRILVIDDEEWLRQMVNIAMTDRGFEVMEAENGAVGIDLARKRLPDLILCDVNMEKVDGYLTLSALRNDNVTASIPFILMTGLADQAGMRHGMELGADDYLPKPFTLEALYAAVDTRIKKAHAVRQEAEKKLEVLRDNISLMLPHELRTPLNGILAYGEMLSTDAATLPVKEIAEMGHVICESGKRLERLIENFLIYAQLELIATDVQKVASLRHSRTDFPGAIVTRQAMAQSENARRQGDLVLHVVDKAVSISEDYLARITDELVQNAFKFSQSGTPVVVELTDFPSVLTLSVTDHGRGFSTEHIARIGAYMQFDRKIHEQQGLGLGLGIAKRLVELHGGTLVIESVRGSSTSVLARLPKVGVF